MPGTCRSGQGCPLGETTEEELYFSYAHAYAVMGQLARDFGMRHYTITTRGPGEQTVRHLHFHLVSVD